MDRKNKNSWTKKINEIKYRIYGSLVDQYEQIIINDQLKQTSNKFQIHKNGLKIWFFFI